MGLFDKFKKKKTKTFKDEFMDAQEGMIALCEALAFPCVIKANGRKIAKITRAFDGYDQLLDLLTERGMVRENGLMDRAKFWVALDRMKMKDVIGRRKKQ